MASKKRTKFQADKASMRGKGDIVELIIASMHESVGVKVERNVFLPTQDGSGRTSEIDVLLSSQVAGYPVRIAIECKNEKPAVGVGEINEFIGKLHDTGIPSQQGVNVSASGFTEGAARRAKAAGVRPLVLKDVTADLPKTVQEAFQSLIYLLATITNLQVRNDVADPAPPDAVLLFRNKEGQICGSVPDLVWQQWLDGTISSELGTHVIPLTIPEGWLQIVNGRKAEVHEISASVQVTGHVVSIIGKVRQHQLLDALTKTTERFQIDASFKFASATYPVTMLATEADLQQYVKQGKGLSIAVGRFRIPRMRLGAIYWPPSEDSVEKVVSRMKAFENGEIPDPRPFTFSEIEGEDLAEAWKAVWQGHS